MTDARLKIAVHLPSNHTAHVERVVDLGMTVDEWHDMTPTAREALALQELWDSGVLEWSFELTDDEVDQ